MRDTKAKRMARGIIMRLLYTVAAALGVAVLAWEFYIIPKWVADKGLGCKWWHLDLYILAVVFGLVLIGGIVIILYTWAWGFDDNQNDSGK